MCYNHAPILAWLSSPSRHLRSACWMYCITLNTCTDVTVMQYLQSTERNSSRRELILFSRFSGSFARYHRIESWLSARTMEFFYQWTKDDVSDVILRKIHQEKEQTEVQGKLDELFTRPGKVLPACSMSLSQS